MLNGGVQSQHMLIIGITTKSRVNFRFSTGIDRRGGVIENQQFGAVIRPGLAQYAGTLAAGRLLPFGQSGVEPLR